MKNRDAGFVLGAVAIGAIIAILSYYFLFAPALAAQSEAVAAAEESRAFNDTLEIQLAAKQAEFERLPEYEALIEEIATELPPRDDLAAFRRDINEIISDEAIVVTIDAANPAVLVEPGLVSLAPQAYAVGRESYIEGLVFQNTYQTQLQVTLFGPYLGVMNAIGRLQLHEGRYYLIAGVDLVDASRTAPAEPATVVITMHSFTLVDAASGIDPGTNSGSVDEDTGEPLDPPALGDPRVPLLDPAQ